MSAAAKRGLVAGILFLAGCAVIGVYIGLYLINVPGSVAAAPTAGGAQLYLATVPAAALNDPHNTWVSYYAVDANAGNWQHQTTYEVRPNTLVHVTIYNYDSASGLRNPFIGQASGTVGGVMSLNGRLARAINPDNASHVFSIPEIGLSVPLLGIPDNAKNPCSNAPCSLSNNHTTTSFVFRSPGKGIYRWQCFVPCAAGYITGFGGPMQAEGYMDGYLKVV